jgi:hypothetical protein
MLRAGVHLRAPSLRRRRGLALRGDPALWALAAIATLGVAGRVYFLVIYHPALLGWSDTSGYLLTDRGPLFTLSWQTAGYPIFLRLLYIIWPRLILVTIVQHILGVVGGLLLFDVMRRARVPRGLGLVPSAVVILGGFELLLEHAILTDAPFTFVVNLSVWCIVMAWSGRRWWAFAAGVSLGLATDDREVGLLLLPVAAACVCLAPSAVLSDQMTSARGRLRAALGYGRVVAAHPVASWRVGALVALVCGALTPILPFLYAHEQAVGSFDFTTSGAVDLYGRVAQWADCAKFTPPAGTAALCPRQAVWERSGSGFWIFSASSPLWKAYGSPYITSAENAKVEAFAIAATEGQPLTYFYRVARDLVRIVDPSFSSSPNPAIDNAGGDGGATPDVRALFSSTGAAADNGIAESFYKSSVLHPSSATLIKDWAEYTELQGPVMLLAIVLALVSPLLTASAARRVSLLCLATAAVLLIGPVATASYSYRYEVPAFGPLAAAAALGAHELWRRAATGLIPNRPPGSM